MKVLFGIALRQTTGFVGSLLRLIGMDWAVPDFGTLSRRQKALKVNIPYRGSDGPLHLLVDSAGIKVEGEGEWTEEGQLKHRQRGWQGGINRQIETRARAGPFLCCFGGWGLATAIQGAPRTALSCVFSKSRRHGPQISPSAFQIARYMTF